MIELQNEFLRIRIKEKGAELCSLQTPDGLEYLWQAEPSVWPRHAPVLFPIVGRLKNNTYSSGEESYSLPQHGFARDRDFDCVVQTDKEVSMDLQPDQETLRLYPFLFHLRITYTLVRATLRTTYTVKNTGESDLLFSIGAHPGFNCPLLKGERLEDYYLEFEKEELRRTLLEDGLLSNRTDTLFLPYRQLPLSHSLFDADALVFANSQINKVWLRSKNHQRALHMDCESWPWFGIWSKKGEHPFICLEPWMGITDKVGSSGKLSEKAGIIRLSPAHTYACGFQISIF